MFAAERDRQRLEDIFRTMLERDGAAQADAQCPLPNEDKTEAVNARFDAAEFNRRLGARLHEVDANAFPPPRIAGGGFEAQSGIESARFRKLLGNARDSRLRPARPFEPIEAALSDRLHHMRP